MSAPSSTKIPRPIYMDHDLYYIPRLTYDTVNHWQLAMLNHLEGNGLIDYIDSNLQPPQTENSEWSQMDDLVRQLIISTFQVDFLAIHSPSLSGKTSAQVWDFIIQNVRRPPAMTHPDRVSNLVEERRNFVQYLPLHKAAVEGNLKILEEILKKEPTAVRAMVTGASETALMIASMKKENHDFVKKLISLMSAEELAMQSSLGRTAMFEAAMAGNVEAMRLMVEKNPSLPNIHDIYNQIPLYLAAYTGQKASVNYLMNVTSDKFFKDLKGSWLAHILISGGFFDICLYLLRRFPILAVIGVSPLESLTFRHSAFLSGVDFSFWERMIYSCKYLYPLLESNKSNVTKNVAKWRNTFLKPNQPKEPFIYIYI